MKKFFLMCGLFIYSLAFAHTFTTVWTSADRVHHLEPQLEEERRSSDSSNSFIETVVDILTV